MRRRARSARRWRAWPARPIWRSWPMAGSTSANSATWRAAGQREVLARDHGTGADPRRRSRAALRRGSARARTRCWSQRALASRVRSGRSRFGLRASRGASRPVETLDDGPGEFVALTSRRRSRRSAATASWTASTSRSARARIWTGWSARIRDALPRSYLIAQAGHAQRGEPAHAAGLPLESARAQLYLAGGGRISDLQHDLGQRGAAAGGDRRAARRRRVARARCFALFLAEACCSASSARRSASCWDGCWRAATVQLIAGTVNALYTTSRPAPVELTVARGGDRDSRSGQRWHSSQRFGAGARSDAGRADRSDGPRRARAPGASCAGGADLRGRSVFAALAVACSQVAPIGGQSGRRIRRRRCSPLAPRRMASPAVVLAVDRATRGARSAAGSKACWRGAA